MVAQSKPLVFDSFSEGAGGWIYSIKQSSDITGKLKKRQSGYVQPKCATS